MNNKIDFNYLLSDTRARVYLLWATLLPIGFIATHYYQRENINILWIIISIIGLGYMYKVMPLKNKQMKQIFASWLAPITVGIIISGLVFYINSIGQLQGYLGGFWLLVMAVGYLFNGLSDPPSHWYWFACVLNIVAGIACFIVPSFVVAQYIIAASISSWSMLYLWLYRSS
ncbi:MAG: hypothetical protein NVSMB46_09770 [Candidatus Saccharimonadales bacterium]